MMNRKYDVMVYFRKLNQFREKWLKPGSRKKAIDWRAFLFNRDSGFLTLEKIELGPDF